MSEQPIQSRRPRFKTFLPEWWHRRRWNALAERIWQSSEELAKHSDSSLQRRACGCRGKIKLLGLDDSILIEVFALVREISGRVHGMRHHHVQILGALAMAEGWIAEMGTGEGKTLTSLMTITLLALRGKGCHVLTANDYLASRDRDFGQILFNWFGLSSSVLKNQESSVERAQNYGCDVTYGSEKEFGFDFLRDRLNRLAELEGQGAFHDHLPGQFVQRGHPFAIIDEADSILIDQASTPLMIACPKPPSEEDLQLFHWSDHVAGNLIATIDYSTDANHHRARLTRRGCRKLRLTQKPLPIGRMPAESVFSQVERAIAARHFYRENQEYVIIDERIEILDQGTGRILPGRKWRDGLQQAIEVQAGVTPSDSTGSAARITLQAYLQKYQFLCGMTGTAAEARGEFRGTYQLRVTSIAPHRPSQLMRYPSRVFVTAEQKWHALAEEAQRLIVEGRSILIGTTSITASEWCASLLIKRGLDCRVLHAKHDQQEAEIVREAGRPGRITVATNMAGRGTDIKLDPLVKQAGGLHVILSEMNRSPRIDCQLAGRAARQGDPGSYQIFVSLEDELLNILGAGTVARLKHRAAGSPTGELGEAWLAPFSRAQRLFERLGEKQRRQLLIHERKQQKVVLPLGLDPTIEMPGEH